ncbi:nucleotidyltransferase domain-containing protein [Horticoccus sp. 23ND18S-11]|uniref:nucleotidyltransferase domain-containing protein n=1 Tax=Horticoccus sp. 23ND18S-11 TaxID=3391832 RepID=UPI0039C9B505
MSLLADFVRSPVRAELLRVFFGLRRGTLYRAELIKLMPFAKESVETQLKALKDMRLIVTEKDGNRVYYSANQLHPLYPDLRSIVLKTVGLRDVLTSALTDKEIEFAFVFGSIASMTDKPESDVDLMVIGDVTEFRLAQLLRGVGDQVGREINPHVYTRNEVTRRVESNDHFLKDVLQKPKLFLSGDEHEFDRLAQRGLDSTP